MEFVIAFFGIIWLLFKFVGEKTREAQYERYSKPHLEERMSFSRKYEATSDEMHLVWWAVRKNLYNGQKVTDFLREDLLYIYGPDYKKVWDSTEFSVIGGMKYWVGNILLATTGKITPRGLSEGYYFSSDNREQVRRICQRIEIRLRENGVNTRLLFEPRKDKSTNWIADYDFTNAERFVYEQNLFWEFDKNRCRVW